MRDRKSYSQKYYQENKEDFVARRRRYNQDGRYKDHEKSYNFQYRQEHKEQLQYQREQARLEVLSHYSVSNYPVCARCGIVDTDILTIDHISNNGSSQRQELGWRGSGIYFYKYLKENRYPLGYQVLCHNCNWKKRIQGIPGRL